MEKVPFSDEHVQFGCTIFFDVWMFLIRKRCVRRDDVVPGRIKNTHSQRKVIFKKNCFLCLFVCVCAPIFHILQSVDFSGFASCSEADPDHQDRPVHMGQQEHLGRVLRPAGPAERGRRRESRRRPAAWVLQRHRRQKSVFYFYDAELVLKCRKQYFKVRRCIQRDVARRVRQQYLFCPPVAPFSQ